MFLICFVTRCDLRVAPTERMEVIPVVDSVSIAQLEKDTLEPELNLCANVPFVSEVGIKPAEFPGGKEKLREFITANKVDVGVKIKGYVIVSFGVDTTGRLFCFEIPFPMKDCARCNEEALRIAKLMPMWKPALDLDENGKETKRLITGQWIKVYF